MTRRVFIIMVALICSVLALGAAPAETPRVLIIQDEMPQMQVLAKFLREEGKLSVTMVDQQSLTGELSPYQAVIVFIHGKLEEKTEKCIIEYTRNGGKLICLHHSISSRKAQNKFYFNFLGMRLDAGSMEEGGYKWKASGWSLVNLNSQHYITNSGVKWDKEATYTCSDYPSSEGTYPSITFGPDSEVFVNHKFIDGREKTILCGIIYRDAETGKIYMQDRGAWIKKQGKGMIFYFMPGHAASDYHNRNVTQIILNVIEWPPERAYW